MSHRVTTKSKRYRKPAVKTSPKPSAMDIYERIQKKASALKQIPDHKRTV